MQKFKTEEGWVGQIVEFLSTCHDYLHLFLVKLRDLIWVLGTITFTLFTLAILVHVIGRYTGTISLIWAYEFSKFASIWITYIFAAVYILTDNHLKIMLIFDKFSLKNRVRIRMAQLVLIGILGIVFIYYGYEYATVQGSFSESSGLGIQMTYAYAIFPIAGILMILYTIDKVALILKDPEQLDDVTFQFEEA